MGGCNVAKISKRPLWRFGPPPPRPPAVTIVTEVRGYQGFPEQERMVSKEGGGAGPHISSLLIQYERVGRVNWTLPYSTMARRDERVVGWAYSQGQDESWQHTRRVPLVLFLTNVTFYFLTETVPVARFLLVFCLLLSLFQAPHKPKHFNSECVFDRRRHLHCGIVSAQQFCRPELL